MSSWSENWIYNLIPQEEYELAFDMVNGKSISCVLNQEEEIDYSKIEHVQEILELTLMDILKSEDVNEKDVAEVSQKIYLLLSALPMPVDSIEKAKHVLKILVYSYIGEQWESGRRYLIENNINILVEEKDDWNICVFKKICNALFLLVKKENWKDLTMACQLISELREDQKKFELYYINSIAPSNKMLATYELISLYHLAKIVDLMATFMINGEILDIREQIGMHFGKAIEAAEEGGIVSLNLILIMLQRMLQKMISNSVWMVTQRVNSRVTKFVRNITTQDKAVFELMYPQKHAILEEGLLDPAHKAIVVNMPTSSGKTLIAQFRILQALNQFSEDNGWVVYIAPTRALVNQVAAKLKREFEPIGIKVEKMSGAIEIDSFESNMLTDSEDRFDVLVVTPEKMNLLIRDGIETKMGRPLALAVVDEAHNIEEESRGINLEILLANIKNDCSKANFLLLTPFIKNSEEIAKWLDADSPKSISLAIDWKPNKRILGAIYPEGNRRNWKLFYQTLLTNSAEIQLEKKMVLSDEALIDVTRSNLNKMKLAIASTKRLADRKGVLVIGGHVKDCWNIAHALYEELELECNDNDVELVKKYVAAEYGEEFELVKLLSKGIAVHHSGLSDEVRVLIEWLMERGKLNILVATTTIAQGINFPVSTIIMASIAYPYTSEMPIRDFWNLVGRAGRAGLENFYMRCNSKLNSILFSALNNLSNRSLIDYQIQTMIVIPNHDKSGAPSIHYVADDNEIKKILKVERSVLNSMGLESKNHAACTMRLNEFYNEVNAMLFDLYGWERKYERIKIVFNEDDVQEAITKNEYELKMLYLNELVIESIDKNAQTVSDNRMKKALIEYGEYVKDWQKDNWGKVPRLQDVQEIFTYPRYYVDIQRSLSKKFLSIKAEKEDSAKKEQYDKELKELFANLGVE